MLVIYLSMLNSDEERNLFTERYEQFRFGCLRIAVTILHDNALAEDAVHEAFLSIIRQREKYLSLSCSDFRKSIIIIVRNKCIDILRREKRTVEFPTDDNIFEDPSNEPSVEDQVILRADVLEVSNYLNRLDEISRQVLYLKYVQGLSYREIGLTLNMAEKTVEVRIARAKKKVRNMINERDSIYE